MSNLTETSMAVTIENNIKPAQEGIKKPRKRFTRADHQVHEELIIEAVKNKQSLKLLARNLGLSAKQMKSYVADLAEQQKISFEGYRDNVVTKEKLLSSILLLLGVQEENEILFLLEHGSDARIVVKIANNSNINPLGGLTTSRGGELKW